METSNIWLITDTHFGHANIIKYCDRPYDFEMLIFQNLEKVIKKDDLLIHLGDFCFGNNESWHHNWKNLVPCRKWLVRGNHDKQSNHWYLTHGWDWIGYKFQDRFFGKNILFSHTPEHFVNVTSELYGSGSFDFNIFGHFHNHLPRLQKRQYVVAGEKERNEPLLKNITNKHILLSIELSNYKPVLLNKIIPGV